MDNNSGMPLLLDDAIEKLLNATEDTPQRELKLCLKKLYTSVPRHGINPSSITKLIRFVFESKVLSIETKYDIIEKYLIPNDTLTHETFYEVLIHLGEGRQLVKEANIKSPAPRKLQVKLCQWLINVYFLFSENMPAESNSILIHLWQYNYLQKWITYLLVWNTKSKTDIRRWKVNLLNKISYNSGYENSRVHTALILKRYLSVVGQSQLIQDSLKELNYDRDQLKELQNLKFEKDIILKLKRILTVEQPFKFTTHNIDDHLNNLIYEISDSDINETQLNFGRHTLEDKSEIYHIDTLSQLSHNWSKITLPYNVEKLLLNTKYTVKQLYPLAIMSNKSSLKNKEIEEFWKQMYEWISINLKRCFFERFMKEEERSKLIDSIFMSCQLFDVFIPKLIQEFLTLDKLLSNESLFIKLCTNLVPLLPLPDRLPPFRTKVLKILATCHLAQSGITKKKKEGLSKVNILAIVSNSFVCMLENWAFEYKNNKRVTLFSLELLSDLRRLILNNICHSLEDRFLNTSIIIILDSIPHVSYENYRIDSDDFLDKVILKNSTIDKLSTLDDPLVLNACCKYLIQVKEILVDRPASDPFVQLHNQYIMDLTNYLWRNRIANSRKIFNIPTEFLKRLGNNCFLPAMHLKLKALYSITSIPAMSYPCIITLSVLEKEKKTQIQYDTLLNEEGFKKFIKRVRNLKNQKGVWLDDIDSLTDLKVEVLKGLARSNKYFYIIKFLVNYLKSLSNYDLLN